MRLRSVLSEAWRDTATGTSRAALWALVWIAFAASLLGADIVAVSTVLHSQQEFREQGGDIQVVQTDGGIDIERCLSLGQVDGVIGVFALRKTDRNLGLSALPSSVNPVFEYAGNARDVLAVTAVGGEGILVSEQLAKTMGLNSGDHLTLVTGGSATVRGVFAWPEDGRLAILSGAVLEGVPADGDFDECWVRVWPVDDRLAPLSLSAADSNLAENPRVGPLNQKIGEGESTKTLLAGRVTEPVRFVLPAIGLLIGLVATRIRRIEIANNLQAGSSKGAVVLTQSLESLAWSAPAALLVATVGAALTVSRVASNDASAVVWNVCAVVICTLATTTLGAAIGALSVRKRSLYRYSKDR